jgi:uncharacterized repeat protein (TIGR02543 family)
VLLFFGCAADKETPIAPKYLVTFDTGDEGSTIPSQTIVEGDTAARPVTPPTRAGAFFVDWYADEDCTIPYYFTTTRVTGPLTIYAKWKGYETVGSVADYLASASGGGNPYNPISFKVDLNLDDSIDGWKNLLFTIDLADRYVELDLSDCTMKGIKFDPGTEDTGEKKIVSLILPNAAQDIEESPSSMAAFRYFVILKEISGSNMRSISDRAFENCGALKTVSFPRVTYIGDSAFYYTDLETAYLPEATYIGDYAFQYTALGEANFTEVEKIGEQAFDSCKALVTVNFPEAIEIGDFAFQSCSALGEADFPQVTTIGRSAFYDCRALKTANFPQATSIGDEAFQECIVLNTVSFPDVTSIGTEAFLGCIALNTVSFSKAETIGSKAFEKCSALATASFPKLTSIGDFAFKSTGGTSLEITFEAEAPTVGTDIFSSVEVSKPITVKIPFNTLSSYNSDWKDSFTGGNPRIELNIKTY